MKNKIKKINTNKTKIKKKCEKAAVYLWTQS